MPKASNKKLQTIALTITALIAFAANSVLCRLALKDASIDASSFTIIRLFSGVLMFVILLGFSAKAPEEVTDEEGSSWKNGLALFIYAITFSFAYISLDTGTGALILFGAVQLTMIMSTIVQGNKLRVYEGLGVAVSFTGLAYLVYPTLTTPSLLGFVLMVVSGIAWGVYTLAGRASLNPLRDSAANFRHTIPFVILLMAFAAPSVNITLTGVLLAVASGALASALGYVVWYAALAGLAKTEAAVVQLSVPVIAAIGGVIFVSESISMRLIIACILVLGGILTVLLGGGAWQKKH